MEDYSYADLVAAIQAMELDPSDFSDAINMAQGFINEVNKTPEEKEDQLPAIVLQVYNDLAEHLEKYGVFPNFPDEPEEEPDPRAMCKAKPKKPAPKERAPRGDGPAKVHKNKGRDGTKPKAKDEGRKYIYTRAHAAGEAVLSKVGTMEQLAEDADRIYVQRTGRDSNPREAYTNVQLFLRGCESLGIVSYKNGVYALKK